MGVLVDHLRVLANTSSKYEAHAKASLRLLERHRRKKAALSAEAKALAPKGFEEDYAAAANTALKGAFSAPQLCQQGQGSPSSSPASSIAGGAAVNTAAMKEVQSEPEFGVKSASLSMSPTVTALLSNAGRPAGLTSSGAGLKLQAGCYRIPHPRKAGDGEDSSFVCPNGSAIGISDGVGEWEWRFKINPRAFADELMEGAKHCLAGKGSTTEMVPAQDRAMRALTQSFATTTSFGSATALVAALSATGEELGIANLGDSGARQIRWCGPQGLPTVVAKTAEQQHSFNCPYQLSRLPVPEDYPRLLAEGKHALVKAVQRCNASLHDRPEHAELRTFSLQPGDLIVLGTDGVFDNLFDNEVCEQLAKDVPLSKILEEAETAKEGRRDPAKLAAGIATAAFARSSDPSARTPFGRNAKEAGFSHTGGKMDDITVVVAWVVQEDSPAVDRKE